MRRVTLIATALDRDDIVAAAEGFEHRVHLIGLRPASRLATYDTVVDFGGKTMALCALAGDPVVVAGAWERHGACAYDAITGALLWQRKDLKRVGSVAPAADGRLVAIGLDMRAMQLLSTATGETALKLRAADRLWQSRYASVAVTNAFDDATLYNSETWQRIGRAKVPGFAALSASFAPDCVLISSTGGLTCLDLQARVRWQVRAPEEVMYHPVAWEAAAERWLAIEYHVNRKFADSLVRLSLDGTIEGRSLVEGTSDHSAEFLPGGRHLLTTSGRLVDTETGGITIAFTDLALN